MVSLVSGRVLGLSGDTLVSSSILGLTLIACGTSAFPMLLNEQEDGGEATPRQAGPNGAAFEELGGFSDEEGGSEGLRWTLIGGLSLFPFLNWAAWVLAALESPSLEDKNWRYVLAALYLAPWLHAGGGMDALATASLMVGAVHVQLERALEARGLKRQSFLNKDTLQKVPQAVSKLSSETGRVAEVVAASVDEPDSRARTPDTGTDRSGVSAPLNVTLPDVLDKAVDVAVDVAVEAVTVSKKARSRFQDRLVQKEVTEAERRAEAELLRAEKERQVELEEWDAEFRFRRATVPELYVMAKQRGMRGYSKMKKEELRQAIIAWDARGTGSLDEPDVEESRTLER